MGEAQRPGLRGPTDPFYRTFYSVNEVERNRLACFAQVVVNGPLDIGLSLRTESNRPSMTRRIARGAGWHCELGVDRDALA